MATFSNWPNDWTIEWSKQTEVFGHPNQIIVFFLPWILLLAIFCFRRKIGAIDYKYTKYIWNVMGAFAIVWEFWFDIATITHGTSPFVQFKNGFDLCRLNTYLIGAFLLFRKVEWVKWIVATALWGGVSTLFNHYNTAAPIHSIITHAVILPTFPAFAITLSKTNYSFKSYVYAHLFNWTIVIFLICLNYSTGETHGELREDHLQDNVLVGWAPYGLRIILWILVAMVVELCYFLLYRYVFWQTYENKNIKKTIWNKEFTKFNFGNKEFVIGTHFNTYQRENKFWKLFSLDFKESLKLIPTGPKRTYLSAKQNIKTSFSFVKNKLLK